MNKLTLAQIAERDRLVTLLKEKGEAVRDAVDDFNAKTHALWQDEVTPILQEYNDALNDANGLCFDIAESVNDYIGERVENWVNSPRGCAYAQWRDTWVQYAVMFEVVLDGPVEVEPPTVDNAEVLAGLPLEPEKEEP